MVLSITSGTVAKFPEQHKRQSTASLSSPRFAAATKKDIETHKKQVSVLI